jgi:alpha-galactosidase
MPVQNTIPPLNLPTVTPRPTLKVGETPQTAFDTLAMTPPMGWNSWNMFGKVVSEDVIKKTADAMVSSGMKDAGYQYVIIDDDWQGGRDKDGRLIPDPKRFPSGMRTLADYVHSKGLKLGIYSDAGDRTCGGQAGSAGSEELDAKTFADWTIDYLKFDYCNAKDDGQTAILLYTKMGQAMVAAGRPMIYSVCEWGTRRPWEWAATAGAHLWRTGGDITDSWAGTTGGPAFNTGIAEDGFVIQKGLEGYAGPGHWNDPDMLVVGLKGKGSIGGMGCTDDEYRTQFGLWCLLAAPLIAVCDLSAMDKTTLEIMTNAEILALNQDALGKQGKQLVSSDSAVVIVKPLQNGDLGVGLFNRSASGGSPHRFRVGLGHQRELFRARPLAAQRPR